MLTALQCLALFWLIPMLAAILIAIVKQRRASARRFNRDPAMGTADLVRELMEQTKTEGLAFTISVLAAGAGNAVLYFDVE